MTQEELHLFRELLAKYLDMQCAYCHGRSFEDRHIVTCIGCGVVVCDLRDSVEIDEDGRTQRQMLL